MSRFFAPFKPSLLFSLLAVLYTATPASAALTDVQAGKEKPVHVENKNAPTILRAEQLNARESRDMYMDYDVEVERDQTIITGDHGVLHNEENEADMVGNVFIQRFGDQFAAKRANYNMDTDEGTLKDAYYKLEVGNRQGRAQRIDLTGKDTADLYDSTLTTCDGLDPDWYLKTSKLHLDTELNDGAAESPVLYFKDVPILGAPALTFPVTGERKSGLLPPTAGFSTDKGIEIAVPYYFNLAPNYDFTLYNNLMTKHGHMFGGEYRYLGENYEGMAYAEYMPNDRKTGHHRYLYATQHQQRFADGWAIKWDYRGASDNDYPDDFSMWRNAGSLNTISAFKDYDDDDDKRKLRRYGQVSKSFSTKNFGSWNASLTASGYQILQDWNSIIRRDHSRLPQFVLSGHDDNVGGFDWTFKAEATRFWLDNRDMDLYWGNNWKNIRDWMKKGKYRYNNYKQNRGNRYVLEPTLSYPVYHAGWFVVPKAKLTYTKYKLDDVDNRVVPNTSLTRTLPTFTLDTGLTFERDSSLFGDGGLQTLEPRLFYAYTPYKDQDEYPLFDTSQFTFGYAKLFADNPYSGYDRIADQNSITAALTTRFLEDDGTERLRFTAGQKFNFVRQRVFLSKSSNENSPDYSDLLLQASGQLTNEFSFDSNLQYGLNHDMVDMGNISMHWKPGPRKALNFEYRYMRDENDEITGGEKLDQTILSGQWPLSDRWYIVGQHNYSYTNHRVVESIAGLEYNADCWVLRLVAQHEATSSDDSNTSLYVQLELKGFARLGNDPVKEIQEKVTGYDALTERYQKDDTF